MKDVLDFTVGFPVRNRISFANQAIQCILDNCNYPIIIIDDNSDSPDAKYIEHPRVKVIYNKEKKGLTSLWNQILIESETEYIIFSGDKLRPKQKDFQLIEQKLKEGFALVATYMIGFMGFSKHLTTKIGFHDTGFKANGFEDTDLMNKLFVNDLGMYFSKETEYVQVGTGWLYNSINRDYYITKWNEDWINGKIVQLKDDENSGDKSYFLNKFEDRQYFGWNKSELKADNIINYYRNKVGIKQF